MKKRTLNIQDLCMIGVMTAVICIMAQISIPMPFGVPMTMQTFAVAIAGIILGSKNSSIATLIYVLIGSVGIPVFSNFTGGYERLVGPTGGFILSFPIMAYLIGLGMEYQSKLKGSLLLGLIVGNVVNLLFGTVMFCFISGTDFIAGLAACALPFLPVTVIKMILAWSVGLRIRKHLSY